MAQDGREESKLLRREPVESEECDMAKPLVLTSVLDTTITDSNRIKNSPYNQTELGVLAGKRWVRS